MNVNKTIIVALVALTATYSLCRPAEAQTTVFDFTGGSSSPHHADLDEMLTASTVSGTVTATVTAVSSSGDPEINFDGTDGVGVNIMDNINDETDKLDAAVADESMQFEFDQEVILQQILIDGMAWSSATDYEYCDLFVNGVYEATLLDTDVDATTISQHANPIVGAASDTFENLGIVLAAGDVLTLSYFEAGANNGWRIEQIGVDPTVDDITVVPDSVIVTRGTLGSGGAPELAASDNIDLSIFRSTSDIQAVTEFEATGTSAFDNPTSIEVTLEGSVFARSTVEQTVELFDFDRREWVEIDVRNAARFSDSTVVIPVTAAGDFVENGTLAIQARVRYRSLVARQRFTSNTDLLSWTLNQ